MRVSYRDTREDWKVARDKYNPANSQAFLEQLIGPGEQHHIDPSADCINPKCGYHFTPEDEAQIRAHGGEFSCPQCGFTQDVWGSGNQPTYVSQNPDAWYDLQESGNLDVSSQRPANPGGRTNSGLNLKQMGDIGEAIVNRMGELPNIGTVVPAHQGDYNFPIDCIVESQNGRFGCEVKSNHSTAQQRFKIGKKKDKLAKLEYCFANGLKPALVGVRLNFFTNRADIFFREGLVDTWVSNKNMIWVASVDFADLNPFKSPDPQAQAIAVQNAHLPDQSEDEEFDSIFGPEPAKQQVTAKQLFTVPFDVHELRVEDTKGNHLHTIKRCGHCGVLYQRPAEHTHYFECPTCDQDVDEEPGRLDRVVFAGKDAMDDLAKEMGWQFDRKTGKGERIYVWTDGDGFTHDRRTGPGGSHGNSELDAMHSRQRMQSCMRDPWSCVHAKFKGMPPENRSIDTLVEPKAPVFRKGQTIEVNDQEWLIQSIDKLEGLPTLIAVTNIKSGAPAAFELDEIPEQKEDKKKTAAKDPDYLFIYYMSELRVEEAEPGVRHKKMIEDLLAEFGNDTSGHKTEFEMDTTDVAAGEIREYDDDIQIEHMQLSKPEVRDEAERLIYEWYDGKKSVFDTWGEPHGPGPDRDEDTGQWVAV